jgi:hypothetical protein
MSSSITISQHFDKKVPRYGDSYLFKAYKIVFDGEDSSISYSDSNELATIEDIEGDLGKILNYYKRTVSIETKDPDSSWNKGVFLLEKYLEGFLLENWEMTPIGKKYDLIIEEGELLISSIKLILA